MGKQIVPQAKQIIIRVIEFCLEEMKSGLLAPRHQAIKRACLATGLSRHTIMKIRSEAKKQNFATFDSNIEDIEDDQMYHESDDDEMLSDLDEASGPGEALLSQSNTNENGPEPTSSTMETVLVKMEPHEADEEDSSQPANSPGESDPSYCVPIKDEPLDEDEDGEPTTTVLMCEFEASDDPLLPPSERVKQEGPTQEGGGIGQTSSRISDKENSNKKKRKSPASKQTTGTTGGRRYECHICHKILSASSKLKTHLTLHTGEKPFACNICQSTYSHKKGLQRHMKTHTGKQFQCSICQKSFKENSKLNRHIKSHTGEKPFECHMCERRFIRNEELQIHLRTHTGEKPYECSVCHTRFTQKITLQKHLRTHTGKKTHECSICRSWFACSSSLQVHVRTHTGVKPYECSVCPSRFAQSIHLQRHLRRHGVGEKPYECDICHNRYPEKYQLKTHILTHTVVKS